MVCSSSTSTLLIHRASSVKLLENEVSTYLDRDSHFQKIRSLDENTASILIRQLLFAATFNMGE